MEKVPTIHHLDLNQEEIGLACSLINRYGSGDHPVADINTYHGFCISYLREIITKIHDNGVVNNLSEKGKETLKTLEGKCNNSEL